MMNSKGRLTAPTTLATILPFLCEHVHLGQRHYLVGGFDAVVVLREDRGGRELHHHLVACGEDFLDHEFRYRPCVGKAREDLFAGRAALNRRLGAEAGCHHHVGVDEVVKNLHVGLAQPFGDEAPGDGQIGALGACGSRWGAGDYRGDACRCEQVSEVHTDSLCKCVTGCEMREQLRCG